MNSPVGSYTLELTKNIDLIREINEVSELNSFQNIRNILKNAERLYILGFGYYRYNTEILGFPNSIPKVEEVYSTRKKLMGRNFDNRISKLFINHKLNIEDISCTDLLIKYDLQ